MTTAPSETVRRQPRTLHRQSAVCPAPLLSLRVMTMCARPSRICRLCAGVTTRVARSPTEARTPSLSPSAAVGLVDAEAVSSGAWHSCALRTDKTVVCWGSNVYGRLGDGTEVDRLVATPVVGLTNVVEVTGGGWHTCARTASGSVWCWGYNGGGRLGDNTMVNRSTPVAVYNLTDAVSVSAGSWHTCALRAGGTVACWGINSNGQLAYPDLTAAFLAPLGVSGLTGVTAISSGDFHVCALRSDQTVWCWGQNTAGQLGDGTTTDKATPTPVAGLSGVVAISAGGKFTCALRSNQSVWCWGNNGSGQLGDGTTVQRLAPTATAGLPSVTQLSAGGNHVCARGVDGSVWCWGYNYYGEIGNGSTSSTAIPRQVPGLTGATAVSAGLYHSCALRSDKTVWCWGQNYYGQVGNGERTGVLRPSTVGGFTLGAPSAGDFVSLVPGRLVDTRTGGSTADGVWAGVGTRPAGSVSEVQVGGRGGVASTAVAAVLTVTVMGAKGGGYLTVWPCGSVQPNASSVNFTGGQTIPNMVVAKLGTGGRVCVFTSAARSCWWM